MIIGHHRQIQYLNRVLAKGTLAHAYLFYGPDSVGKKAVALECAQALFCQEKSGIFGAPRLSGTSGVPAASGSLGSCNSCSNCRQATDAIHPDLILLSPDRPLVQNQKSGIGIASIQELERRLSLAPWADGWRIVLIDQAQAMSFAAQSALLKILEEPGPRTVFFIITSSPRVLLPTIRSRCVPLSFSLVSDDMIQEGLKAYPSNNHELQAQITKLCSGRPGLALRLAENREMLDREEKKAGFYQKLLGANLDEQFRFSDGAGRDSEELKAFFEFCLRTLASSLTAQPKSFEAAVVILKAAAKSYELLESTTVNRRLLADAFFAELIMPKIKL